MSLPSSAKHISVNKEHKVASGYRDKEYEQGIEVKEGGSLFPSRKGFHGKMTTALVLEGC